MTKISIITVNYNNGTELERTLKSIHSQTYKDFEHIVIDGGSNDKSVDIIKKYSDKIHYWCSEPDGGIYEGMNKGIAKASGQYLLFLNSGDYLNSPDILDKISPSLDGTDIIYGDLIFIETKNSTFTKIYPDNITLQYLLEDSLPHPASFIRKELFNDGGYDTRFRIVADWEFWCRKIIFCQCTTRHIPTVISTFFLGGISSQKQRSFADRKAAYNSLFPPMIAEKIERQILLDKKGLDDLFYQLASTKKLHKRISPFIRLALKIDRLLKRKHKG